MTIEQAHVKINEYYSQYISPEYPDKNAIKAKLITIVCDTIKIDFSFKKLIENDNFDYLPVLIGTNNALKYFNPNSKNGCFHKYLFTCINQKVKSDINKNTHLNENSFKELKKAKKLLKMYNENKENTAKAMGISLNKLNALLNAEVCSFDAPIENTTDNTTLIDVTPSQAIQPEVQYEVIDNINEALKELDEIWKQQKAVHQKIISDWLTATTLSDLEKAGALPFMENPEDTYSILFKFSFINQSIIKNYFNDKNYKIPLTCDIIAANNNVTKSAVSKKVAAFLEDLKKYQKN